ncbi:MAG TPA: response regulator [Acidobacteriaceae bacterium]|nr:response regulator [Acidobacteriaceae bacterium]
MDVLLIDDELAARERLRRLLRTHANVNVMGEAENGLEGLQQIQELQPDVIFLDIQMPGLDGFQMLRELPSPEQMPLVIFATSFEQHALRAFKENALAYLLKPIQQDFLDRALDRASRLLASAPDREEEAEKTRRAASTAPPLRNIVGHKQNSCFLLKPEDVFLFSIVDGIVRARTVTDNYWLNHPIGYLEESLEQSTAGRNFFRARRDVLVNLNHVRVIRPYDRSTFVLVMADPQNTEIIVSERQAKLLREKLPGL